MENDSRLPAPYPSWTTYDAVLRQWFPPVPYPDDGKNYQWDEPTLSWISGDLNA